MKKTKTYVVSEGATMKGKSLAVVENEGTTTFHLAICQERDIESRNFHGTALWEPKMSKTVLAAQGEENFQKLLSEIGIEVPKTKDLTKWAKENPQWIAEGMGNKKLVLVFTKRHGENDTPFQSNGSILYMQKPKLSVYKEDQDGEAYAFKFRGGVNFTSELTEDSCEVYSFYSLEDEDWPNSVADDTIAEWVEELNEVPKQKVTTTQQPDMQQMMLQMAKMLQQMQASQPQPVVIE